MGGVAPRRILLAEDDSRLAFAIQALLEVDRRWTVVVVGDADHAVERALADRPDVVVLDVRLDLSDGIEAAERIRGAWDDAILVVYSGSEEDLERARRAGFRHVLLKGATADELVDTIEWVGRPAVELRSSHAGSGPPVGA